MNTASRKLVSSLLSLPTMSFHESAIATFVRWYALGLGLSVKKDRAGNLLVSFGGGRGGITLAAHMDHPGFEVIASRGANAAVALWGKVDPKTFAGSSVVVHTAQGAFKGKIGKRPLLKKHLGRWCFSLRCGAKVSAGDFGHYDLPAAKFSRGTIVTRAADNLLSVAAILDLFTRLSARRASCPVQGLFTRGEEAGFLGAFAAMESKFIPRGNPLVVLECSSAAGGNCAMGRGPVIRAGDLASTYDPAVEVWLADAAAALQKSEPSFSYQRALLQGGRCEACVYVAEGYRTGGIALPLGNYHNQGPRGPAAEEVSARDYDNLLLLLEALVRSPMPKDPLRHRAAPLWKHYRSLKRKFLAR